MATPEPVPFAAGAQEGALCARFVLQTPILHSALNGADAVSRGLAVEDVYIGGKHVVPYRYIYTIAQ